jgi:hypothetical protein
MFLCDVCAGKMGVDQFVMLVYPRSSGPCESCHVPSSCVDVPPSAFPEESNNVATKEDTQKPTD